MTGRLVALAHDVQCPVAPLEAEVLNVGRASLADSQPVQSEEHCKSGISMVDPLGREQEGAKLGAVETTGVVGADIGPTNVLRRFEAIRPSMWAKR